MSLTFELLPLIILPRDTQLVDGRDSSVARVHAGCMRSARGCSCMCSACARGSRLVARRGPRERPPRRAAHWAALSPKTKSAWKMPTHMPSSPPTAMSFHSSSSKTGCSTPSNSALGSDCHGAWPRDVTDRHGARGHSRQRHRPGTPRTAAPAAAPAGCGRVTHHEGRAHEGYTHDAPAGAPAAAAPRSSPRWCRRT